MSGPFKMKSGNSPLKESKDWFNIRGYLKGEQGLVPDYKGESTAKTATKVSQAIQKGQGKVKQVVKNMLSPKMTKNNKAKPKADAKMMKVAKPLERDPGPKLTKVKPLGPKKLDVNTNHRPPKKSRYNS
jgi:hypothetical protein